MTSLKDESRLELISHSAVFLGFLLHLEADRTFRVAHLLVNAAPDLWWNLLPLVYQLELDNRLSIHVFIMLKVLLMTVLKADLVAKLNWQPAEMERFCQWILPKLPAKMNDPLSQQCLQLLGLFLLCCRPTLPEETVKEICKFIVTELKHPTLNERSLIVLLELAHRLLSTHEKAESIILQQGIPLVDIWGRAKKSASVLKALIRLEKLLAVREPYKDAVRQLLKLMMDQMEEKESLVVRQLTPIDDDDWTLIETTYDLLVVAASSLEGRRLLVKCRCWNDIAEQWHPVYLKRIRGKQQQWVHAALVTLRAKL